MAVQLKISKPVVSEEKECKESLEASTSVISTNNLNAPKHGTVIPNRVFVGGISSATTELDLVQLFSTYGTVTGTKIISDRAGVSKGYGFVTFETEDEARRLQKADNITLKERRLNIAPAIKKQGFARGGYECTTPTPMPCTSQVYRHNGVTFTFHNGMAFFPQPTPPPVPQTTHVEPSPVFQQGTSYGAVPPGSPGPAYPFSYAPQGQVYYPAPQYQYHIPQYDGCYDPSQVMVTDGSLVMPQYYNYIAPQPTHEIAYFQPTPIHPQDPSQSVQPIIYSSPRGYDSTIVYSSETGSGRGRGKWISKEEEVGNPLTPPITPRSESVPAGTTTASQADDVVQSIQALAI